MAHSSALFVCVPPETLLGRGTAVTRAVVRGAVGELVMLISMPVPVELAATSAAILLPVAFDDAGLIVPFVGRLT